MTKTVTVVHDRTKCIGCRSCILIAPQNWMMDDEDGKATLIGSKIKHNGLSVGEIFEMDITANQKAAAACPRNIIKIAD